VTHLRHRILSVAILAEGAVFALALLSAAYLDIDFLPLTENVFRDILAGSAAAVPPFVFFLLVVSRKAAKSVLFKSLRKIVVIDIREMFSNTTLTDLLCISFTAGIAEEFLFRGVVQAKFGIVTASFLFGIVHFISPLYVIITVIMGFYIGLFYYLYDSLLVAFLIHFIYDLCALVYLRYGLRSVNG
jgi:membrane protease YdiL (CAAX protease family)